MANPTNGETVNNLNHINETEVKSDTVCIEERKTNGETTETQVKPEPPSQKGIVNGSTESAKVSNSQNHHPLPVSNHVGSEPLRHYPQPNEYSPRAHYQERSSRSHLKTGNKVVESRNRRRSFAGETSADRETIYRENLGSKESLGSNSKIYNDAVRYPNNYDGTSIPYERRTGSMGRRECYGERRRLREQNYNGDSPVLRRNVSYGSDMENYGMYDPRSFERGSRRDIHEALRNQQNMMGRGYDPQHPGRGYERSQSASRLGFTESGYDVYPQPRYTPRSGYEDVARRYSEAMPSGVRDQAPPYYQAPPPVRPGVRFEMPARFPGPNQAPQQPPPQQYPGKKLDVSLYFILKSD